MNITAISNNTGSYYQTGQQTQTQPLDQTSSSIGSAAVLDITNTSSGNSIQATGTAQGGSGSASASSSCPLGNSSCLGCGQCGKLTAKPTTNQNNINTQTSANDNYLTSLAISAYETNDVTP